MKLQVLTDELSKARIAKFDRTKKVQEAHKALARFSRRQKALTANGGRVRH